MNIEEYTKMSENEKNYWWHKGKKYLVNSVMEDIYSGNGSHELEILEIGCGTGEITKSLQKYGHVKGIDMSQEAIDYCKNLGLKDVSVADVNQMDISTMKKRFDVVLALDVLEHIQEDTKTMYRVYEMLKDDGNFIINVPAYKFLWSGHDEALHHKRRYSRYELKEKLTDSGFKIVDESYFVMIPFFPIAFFRLFSNVFGKTAYPKTSYIYLPDLLNKFLTNILKLESKVMKIIRLPIGTTLTVVAQKK